MNKEEAYNIKNDVDETMPIQYHGTSKSNAESIIKNGFYKKYNVNATDDYSEALEYSNCYSEEGEQPYVLRVRLKKGATPKAEDGLDSMAYDASDVVVDYSELEKRKIFQEIRYIIREEIKKYVSKDISEITIAKVIIDLRNKFTKELHCSIEGINEGSCIDFVHELINKIGSGKKLTTTYFFTEVDPDDEQKEGNNYLNVISEDEFEVYGNLGFWEKDKLDMYGWPPTDIDLSTNYVPGYHEWVFYNKKHYDAETPNGVNSFWKLPFYKREIELYRRKHKNESLNESEFDYPTMTPPSGDICPGPAGTPFPKEEDYDEFGNRKDDIAR